MSTFRNILAVALFLFVGLAVAPNSILAYTGEDCYCDFDVVSSDSDLRFCPQDEARLRMGGEQPFEIVPQEQVIGRDGEGNTINTTDHE